MRLANFAWLTSAVLGMAAGQLLFKIAARSFATADSLLRGLLSPTFLAALILYAGVTVVWVWQLSLVDLSRAYPFMALSFVFVPLLSALLLGESIGMSYWLGIGLIVIGVLVVQLGS